MPVEKGGLMIRLRAEWEAQKTVIVAMPHEGSDWARRGLRNSQVPFVKIAQAIAYSQPVYLLCRKKAISTISFAPNRISYSSNATTTTHGPETTRLSRPTAVKEKCCWISDSTAGEANTKRSLTMLSADTLAKKDTSVPPR